MSYNASESEIEVIVLKIMDKAKFKREDFNTIFLSCKNNSIILSKEETYTLCYLSRESDYKARLSADFFERVIKMYEILERNKFVAELKKLL